MFLKPLPLGPSACVHLNPGLLPPPLVMSPHSSLALRSEQSGGWGAIQYYFHFRPGIEKVSLDLLNPELHQLPIDFPSSILRYEGWAEPDDLFQIAPPPASDPFPVISVLCPKSSTYGSPDHGLTFCNGRGLCPTSHILRPLACHTGLAPPIFRNNRTLDCRRMPYTRLRLYRASFLPHHPLLGFRPS